MLYRYWTSFRDFSSNSWNTAFDKRLQLFFRALYPTEVRHWLIFKPLNNRVQNLYINRSHFFFMPWKKKWLQFNHTVFVRCPGSVVKYFYLELHTSCITCKKPKYCVRGFFNLPAINYRPLDWFLISFFRFWNRK